MSLFDALHVANQAMHVHRFRSEIAAENLGQAYANPDYERKVVNLGSRSFDEEFGEIQRSRMPFGMTGGLQAAEGAVENVIAVKSVTRDGSQESERGSAMLDTIEMMRSKNAYEVNGRVASMVRSMAISALEIGRGG